MANIFNTVKLPRNARSTFAKNFTNKFTTNLGVLYPILFEEVTPGSRVKLSQSHFVRFQPMLAPIFDNVKYMQYYFYVPFRILFSEHVWENFRTGGKEQNFFPFFEIDNFTNISPVELDTEGEFKYPRGTYNYSELVSIIERFLDSFNVPSSLVSELVQGNGYPIHAEPILAYWRVIMDYFLSDDVDSDISDLLKTIFDGSYLHSSFEYDVNLLNTSTYPSISSIINLFDFFYKRYKNDYFTSALTSPQAGSAVQIPLTGFDLQFDSSNPFGISVTDTIETRGNKLYPDAHSISGISSLSDANLPLFNSNPANDESSRGNLTAQYDTSYDPEHPSYVYSPVDLISNLALNGLNPRATWQQLVSLFNVSGGTPISVEDLRNSFMMQELKERNAVGGTRYFEWIFSQFGLKVPDAVLQRSQFICSISTPINFVEVENNTNDDEIPLGYLAGKGVGGDASFLFDRTFQEDGIIIGLGCFVPSQTYNQGLHRMYRRETGLDYLVPLFSHLGEQEIKNSEIFASGLSTDDEVFGYQSRYAEYKSQYNHQSGDFNGNLNYWTLTRKFDNLPSLSSEFLEINPSDFTDIFPVTSVETDKIICMESFNIEHTLDLPRFGTPARI